MLKVTKREKEGWLRKEDIDNFPCEDLRTIDQLWVKYSRGKFGFSVQKHIYQSLGGTRNYDREIWEAFCDKVGWRQGGKFVVYSDLTFSLDTHFMGHLPMTPHYIALSRSRFVTRGTRIEDENRRFFSRAETCRL